MTDIDHLHTTFKKVFPEGYLARIPRNPQHRDIILAMLSLSLQRRYPYSELELNDELVSALTDMRGTVDHVTTRRYMVDCGFIKRDRAGVRYYLNYLKRQEVLPDELIPAAREALNEAMDNAPRARHRKDK